MTETSPGGVTTDEKNRRQLTVTEQWTVLAGLGAAAPILLCGIRVLAVSNGNSETLRALVQNLDVKALVLASVLPYAATVAFWFQVVIIVGCFNKNDPSRKRVGYGVATFFLLPFTIALGLYGMSRNQLIGNAIVLCISILLVGLGSRIGPTPPPKGSASGCARAFMLLLLLIIIFGSVIAVVVKAAFDSSMWLPQERLTLNGDTVVNGYVLSVDDRWMRYVDTSHTVHVVATPAVTGRQVVG